MVVYKPPSGNITKVVDNLNNLLKLLPKIDKSDVIIGGEFNIDFAKPRKDNTKKLKYFSTKHNLPQLIKSPTRPMDSEAIIDLIFLELPTCHSFRIAFLEPK